MSVTPSWRPTLPFRFVRGKRILPIPYPKTTHDTRVWASCKGVRNYVKIVPVIRLRVPATLRYRDLAVRAVAAACKLVGDGRRDRAFDDQVVSAFGESFNNVTLHAYDGHPPGDVEIQ